MKLILTYLPSSSTLPESETPDAAEEIAHCSFCLSMNDVFSETRHAAADALSGIPDEGKIEITKLGNITFTNLGNGFMMKPERRAESNEPIARARTQGHQKHGNQA